ncbi:unnamed protein product, partial [Rotaria sp. Silwood2]
SPTTEQQQNPEPEILLSTEDEFIMIQPFSDSLNKQDNNFSINQKFLNLQSEQCTPSIELLENNITLPSTQADSIMIHPSGQSIQSFNYNYKKLPDWNLLLSNDNNSTTIDSLHQQSTSTHCISSKLAHARKELTPTEKRKIHNRSCTLRKRKKYYHHELIFRNIDRRFTIKQIKNVLRQ